MNLCENTSSEDRGQRVLLAFGLTTLAGLATTLGALVPIFVSHTKPKYLASALSFAAGTTPRPRVQIDRSCRAATLNVCAAARQG